jgi:hypothetical protein
MSETIGSLADLLNAQSQTTLAEQPNIDALATDTSVQPEPEPTPIAVAPIKTDEEEAADELETFVKLLAKFKGDEDKKAKARRLLKAKEILSRPNIDAEVDAFIQEMAGVRPFEHTITQNGILKFNFQALDSRGIEQVLQQWQRDISAGRCKVGRADSLIDHYKAVLSLRSLVVLDPKTGKVVREVIPNIKDALAKAPTLTDLAADIDLPCRVLYVYARDVLMPNGSMFQSFATAFAEFETLMMDITFLLQEQPDFFRQGS